MDISQIGCPLQLLCVFPYHLALAISCQPATHKHTPTLHTSHVLLRDGDVVVLSGRGREFMNEQAGFGCGFGCEFLAFLSRAEARPTRWPTSVYLKRMPVAAGNYFETQLAAWPRTCAVGPVNSRTERQSDRGREKPKG